MFLPAQKGKYPDRTTFQGWEVHLTTAGILGDLHKSPEAHGAVCHLATGSTAARALISRVAQQNSG